MFMHWHSSLDAAELVLHMGACREGLSARSQPTASDQVQIHIDKGFDFDSEVDLLRAHVGRIKKVSANTGSG